MSDRRPRFIVVDDDPVNNSICRKVITRIFPNADVMTFTEPETGLAYIISTFSKPNVGRAILFLDINMPTMTGWEFIERFEKFGTTIKEQLYIYVLSSSVNSVDKEKAKHNRNIVDYIEKPLSLSIVESLT